MYTDHVTRDFDADASPSSRRPCDVCGLALGAAHGNRRYHPGDCAEEARKARHARNQAAYRARRNPSPGPMVPADFRAGRVTVKGQVLPGAKATAIRAAVVKPLLASLAFHEALKEVPYADVLNSEELGRLRYYVDDVLSLIDVIDDAIRVPDFDTSDLFNPSDGLTVVRRLHVNKKRPGAPVRRRSPQ